MGKLKKKSRASIERRKQVLGQRKKEVDDSTQKKVAPLISKLSSSAPNERSMAISAVSMICDTDSKLRKLFLKEKLVQITMEQLLNDNNDECVMEAWGLLRNLVVDEGYAVAVYTWRNDIWTALHAALVKADASLEKVDGSTGSVEKTLLFDYIENVLGLIEALAEVDDNDLRDEVMNKVLSGNIVEFLLKVKSHPKVTAKLYTFVIGFFYEISSQSLEFLRLSSQKLSLETSASSNSGFLAQLYHIGLDFQLKEVQNAITPQVALRYLETIQTLLAQIDLSKTSRQEAASDIPTKEEITGFQETKMNIQAVDVALDLVSAIVESIGSNNLGNEQIYQVSTNHIIPSLVLISQNEEFVSKALVALYNYSWLLKSEEDWLPTAQEILAMVLPQVYQTEELELKTDYLNLAWVLLSTSGDFEANSDINQVQGLITFSTNLVQSEQIPGNLTGYYTSLIRFLSKLPARSSLEIATAIGDFLVECTRSSLEQLVTGNFTQIHTRYQNLFEINTVECLNAIFDVFGDASYAYDESVYVQRDYSSKLESLISHVKRVFKVCDKSKHPELKEQLAEVMDNLPLFIEYKRSERN
ncbi:unnamed protein product [Kuraishia capsulata CBS 1993]|uniref:SYO1-like TPR repeats domain-containing protein n=1 Tax=Kuraishia capsulata CBS 1993 TaxID=1382522 RepID=W6MJ48_9ASCO|nr:uncharacterized protein KUCA_T00000404001 [Kuraishia capsulata CBS 1993]CDK24442.1 unnamed protein product [Kuraishia capsulata CBS 1993]